MHSATEYVILRTCKEIRRTNCPNGIAEWEHICNFYKHGQFTFQKDEPTHAPTNLVWVCLFLQPY